MRKALGVGLCMAVLGCATVNPLVRAVPGGGYSVDRAGLSYAFAESDPDFVLLEGYAVLRKDLELIGAIIGLEKGTVKPVREGDGFNLVGPIGYEYGSAESILQEADKDKDSAVNTDELNKILYKVLKRLYPDVLQ
tara:strand:- start:3012 stop:3419 length:408 start_codon:yes stop_codon:yes gene_type:complete